jgi:asparagine synthetase A
MVNYEVSKFNGCQYFLPASLKFLKSTELIHNLVELDKDRSTQAGLNSGMPAHRLAGLGACLLHQGFPDQCLQSQFLQ